MSGTISLVSKIQLCDCVVKSSLGSTSPMSASAHTHMHAFKDMDVRVCGACVVRVCVCVCVWCVRDRVCMFVHVFVHACVYVRSRSFLSD